ncbi:MAG: TauD/TfdA family dioxygenase [Candidatus Binatia bacterium]
MQTETQYRSFGAQALHYFHRPHDEVATSPVGGAAAWRGPEVAARDDWIVRFPASEIDELESAARRCSDTPLEFLGRNDFELPTLAPRIAAWADTFRSGLGLLLLRGLPVERWGEELSSVVFWGLGHHLGVPGGQNPQEELLGHVRDYGEDAASPFVRKYRTAANIAFHCDLADIVGLLCLRPAKSGGASRIVSSVAVHDELLRQRPDLAQRLYEPFLLDTRDESRESRMPWVPVQPCCYSEGRLRTFYHSDYFRSVERHAAAPRFTEQERELLDLYEEIASSPALYLDMSFEPGDVQLISNHTVLHARTQYEDWPERSRRRHLLRLWLSLE